MGQVSRKPHIILCYNQTKGGVDRFDQMCQNMNSGRNTRRWPLRVFYNMINIACINAYVIYCHNFHRSQRNVRTDRSNIKDKSSLKKKNDHFRDYILWS